MKKILIIISCLVLLVTGCGKEEKEDTKLKEFNERRSNYIKGIGTTSDNKVVVKYKNNKEEDCYYVFYVYQTTYSQKQITIHNDKESYHNLVNKYATNTYSELVHNYDLLTSEIMLKKNQKVSDGKVKEHLLNKYSDTSKYTIIKSE